MKSKYRIKIATHKEYGDVGVVLANAPDWMTPGNGYLLAHDIIEHPLPKHRNPIGSIDEIVAMGACHHLRVEHYPYLNGGNRHRELDNSDVYTTIERELEHLYYEDVDIPLLKSRIVNYKYVDIVDDAATLFVDEVGSGEYDTVIFPFDKKQIVYYLQLGERLFKRRFNLVPMCNIRDVWELIEEKVDSFIKYYGELDGICADIIIDWNTPSVLVLADEERYYGVMED